MYFRQLITILGLSTSYFLEMSMPIRYAGTMTQTRMRIDSLNVPNLRSTEGQYHDIILLIPVSIFFSFLLLFLFFSLLFS